MTLWSIILFGQRIMECQYKSYCYDCHIVLVKHISYGRQVFEFRFTPNKQWSNCYVIRIRGGGSFIWHRKPIDFPICTLTISYRKINKDSFWCCCFFFWPCLWLLPLYGWYAFYYLAGLRIYLYIDITCITKLAISAVRTAQHTIDTICRYAYIF